MSKNTKNQKSITSFFKTPGQSATNEPTGSKAKASPTVEVKKEAIEEEAVTKLPSSSPPPGPPPEVPVKLVKKPAVIVPPTATYQRQPTHQMEWINLSERFLLKDRNFEVQYAHLYAERLGTMRKMLIKAAENHWGNTLVFVILKLSSSRRFPNSH